MQLNNFIQAYIPANLRTGRDFTGTRGWVNLTNLVLKRYENYGWFKLDRKKETGVEVSNSYWIDIPSDMRLALNIYAPPTTDYQQMDRYYKWQIVNGKLKLKTPFDKAASPDSFTLSGWSDTSVYIDDDDAEDSEYHDHLLVITNGDLSGRNIVVADNDASVGGTSLLTFYHDQSSSSSTSTAGYLTTQFLMLEYMAVYTGLSSQTDEIPIDNRFEYVLAQSLIVEAMSKTDKTFPTQYQLERQMIEDVNSDEFSLPAGTRIRPRRMPGYEECPGRKDDFEYIGDGYDN